MKKNKMKTKRRLEIYMMTGRITMTQNNSQLTNMLTIESTIADATVSTKKAEICTASDGATTALMNILGNQSITCIQAKFYIITAINGLHFRITSMMPLVAMEAMQPHVANTLRYLNFGSLIICTT